MKFINLTEKEMEDIERAIDERLETLQEELMREKKITSLVVINKQQQPIGVLHMHALLQAGVS